MSVRKSPCVSVIIPVLNQREELVRCLTALERQTCPKDRFEVVVVDNGSEPPVADLVARFSRMRSVLEPKPGSYAARNRGIQLARGEILAFIDADCIPERHWIERGVRALRGLTGTGMVGGRIEITFQDPERPTAVELFESIAEFQQKLYLEEWGFCATANLFTTKQTIEQAGPFDDTLRSSGDREWGQRIRSRGMAQVYADAALVFHPARRTLGELYGKTVRVAGGLQDLAGKRGEDTRALLRESMQDLFPIAWIGEARIVFQDQRLKGLTRKLKFAALVWFTAIVRTVERLRVYCGGTSRRT